MIDGQGEGSTAHAAPQPSARDRAIPRRARRIVLTGGPGGGKTTAADMMRRELGDNLVLVPEAATMLFSGGFPRYDHPEARIAAQLAIYSVQRHLETVQASRYPGRVLLCDRGTLDGAAYWPGGPESFLASSGSSIEDELHRYDGVLFFESAAVGGLSIESQNLARTEGVTEAALLDRALRDVWQHHPRFYLIPHRQSFLAKIVDGMNALKSLLVDLGVTPPAHNSDGNAT